MRLVRTWIVAHVLVMSLLALGGCGTLSSVATAVGFQPDPAAVDKVEADLAALKLDLDASSPDMVALVAAIGNQAWFDVAKIGLRVATQLVQGDAYAHAVQLVDDVTAMLSSGERARVVQLRVRAMRSIAKARAVKLAAAGKDDADAPVGEKK